MALYDIADWQPLQIEEVGRQGLFLPAPGRDEAFLVLPADDGLAVLALNGEWTFNSTPVPLLTGRTGILIPDVSIKVDFETMITDGGDGLGRVIRSRSVYGIRAFHRPQAKDGRHITLPISGGNGDISGDVVRLAFPKWQIGKVIDGSWVSFWTVDVSYK